MNLRISSGEPLPGYQKATEKNQLYQLNPMKSLKDMFASANKNSGNSISARVFSGVVASLALGLALPALAITLLPTAIGFVVAGASSRSATVATGNFYALSCIAMAGQLTARALSPLVCLANLGKFSMSDSYHQLEGALNAPINSVRRLALGQLNEMKEGAIHYDSDDYKVSDMSIAKSTLNNIPTIFQPFM